jgi:hypothetical protein
MSKHMQTCLAAAFWASVAIAAVASCILLVALTSTPG